MTVEWEGGLGEPRPSHPLRALQHRSFAVIWWSSLVGNLGFWMASVSYQWLIARKTDSNSFELGLLYFFITIPFLIFSPLGGFLADRFERKRLFVGGQVAISSVALVTGAIVVASTAPVGVLFASAFLLGSALSITAPAQQAIVANVVPRRDLASAVSLQSIGINLARVAGPALTTPLLALGVGGSYFVYSAGALFVAFMVSRLRIPRVASMEVHHGIWSGIGHGLRYARDREPVAVLLMMVAVTAMFGSSFVSMLAVFGIHVLEAGKGGFTGLVTAVGVGAMAGAFFVGYREHALHVRAIAIGMVVFGGVLASFSAVATAKLLIPALVLVAAGGFCSFGVMTALGTIVQRIVAEDMRGRIMSLYLLCWAGGIPIGSVLLGGLAKQVGAPLGLTMFASICAFCGAIMFVRSATYDRALQAAT